MVSGVFVGGSAAGWVVGQDWEVVSANLCFTVRIRVHVPWLCDPCVSQLRSGGELHTESLMLGVLTSVLFSGHVWGDL